MSSIENKILALKVGDSVRIESTTYGNIQFKIEGTEDNRKDGSRGLRVFQAWGSHDNRFVLLESGEDALSFTVPTALEVIS